MRLVTVAKLNMDWVEFRNVSETDAYNLKSHHLSYVKKGAAPNGVEG